MKNKFEKALMAGAAALALGSSPDASAEEKILVASLDTQSKSTSSETVRIQEMTPEVRAFLTKVVGTHFDSGIERWYQAGNVPEAWSKLSLEDLHLLVGYLNIKSVAQPVEQLMQSSYKNFIPADLARLIQKGTMGLNEKAKYDLEYTSRMDQTWATLSQTLIYNAQKNKPKI